MKASPIQAETSPKQEINPPPSPAVRHPTRKLELISNTPRVIGKLVPDRSLLFKKIYIR